MRTFVFVAMLSLGSAVTWAQTIQILSEQEVRDLEAKVASHPEDRASAALLAKNYAFFILGISALKENDQVNGVDPVKADSAFARHAREQLVNSNAVIAGIGGETLWNYSYQVRGYLVGNRVPGDVEPNEARSLAIQLTDRAVSLEPAEPKWRTIRIPIEIMRAGPPFFMPLSDAEAYRRVKDDLAVLKGMEREWLLQYAAKVAVKASALEDAKAFADELLKSEHNTGNSTFFGNMVLGQVALRKGSLEQARAYLLASGKIEGSPQLNSFGPNMSLAKELLEAGDRQTVLAFFEECHAFWKNDRGRLQQWKEQVNAGKVPNFGPNLIY